MKEDFTLRAELGFVLYPELRITALSSLTSQSQDIRSALKYMET